MDHQKHIPATVNASLDARLAPYHLQDAPSEGSNSRRAVPEDIDVEASRAVTPQHERDLRLLPSLKLLFASLGAGNSVVPLGDNSRAARLLSEYANSLRTN
ncbi:MAG: hypothetical protein K0Q92_73 [Steroidobacteraceae bacterium]|jgi:hypothetical protein|nr:hypothetical protein [Steroidobacteraceae bacterium]